ncbi:hypothetical protein N8865_01265 [Francisellaceae bacterium]|nr:hypothetical protein [Francisellaceae bacterium]
MLNNSIKRFKIFGERHTGSNALSYFLMKNFTQECPYYDFLGWKHRRAPSAKELIKADCAGSLFIFTVRDPYDWLISMKRNPYSDLDAVIPGLTMKQFINYPFEDYENVIEMWNEKHRSYMEMMSLVPYACIVRLEDFKVEQAAVYNSVSQYLTPKGEFTPYEQYRGGGNGTIITRTYMDDWKVSCVLDLEKTEARLTTKSAPTISEHEKKEKPVLSEEVIKKISGFLDEEVMSFFGYQFK